jgi:D-lactate dehydrogenase
MLTKPEPLIEVLGADRVLLSETDRVRYASDASPYLLVPQAVAVPRDADDVAAVFRFATAHGRRVVLRAAGTSLNGQAQGDDILLDVRRHFDRVAVEEDGQILRAGPGVVLARANVRLTKHGRVLGPDPASSSAACLGGVVANNASGMACGVTDNSYRTVAALRIVLPTGTVVDTADPDADAHLAAAEPAMVAELEAIRDELRADTALAQRIRAKFAIKNTNGYRLDAFLDETAPAQILRRLLVGSQGTLGFLDEITMRTVPLGKLATTAFLRFPDLAGAAGAVPSLVQLGARAVELMDNLSIRSTRGIAGAPDWMAGIGEDDAALLIEFRTSDPTELEVFEKGADDVLPGCAKAFTRDPAVARGYWAVRKGLLTALGAGRPAGTILLGEDACFPPHRVAEAAVALRETLERHGFDSAVAGHAAAGNLHYSMVFDPSRPADVERYRVCVDEIVDLVLDRFDGSLKGEHGTGRNMAPYVRREWGEQLLGYMRRVKKAIDPAGILGDGVLFTDDPLIHIRNLKTIPSADPITDGCIECGFCEPVCPSRDVTTTPRQRIALGREIARRNALGANSRQLRAEHTYAAVDTCAADSSCAVACPVGIDTGAAMKQHRQARQSRTARRVALVLARRWTAVEAGVRVALDAAQLLTRVTGDRPLTALTRLVRRFGGTGLVPEWLPATPGPAQPVRGAAIRPGDAVAVYYPACVNRIFGAPRNRADATITRALPALAERTGTRLWLPADTAGSCCSTVWYSKGFPEARAHAANDLVERMWAWSDGGRLPVVVDAASCTLGILGDLAPVLTEENRRRHAAITVVDALAWVRTELLPRASVRRRVARAVLHPTCAMSQLGLGADLRALAAAVADDVVEPLEASCCGFAGDRGFLHREVTESATRREAEEVHAADADLHLSGNRTCELGLEHATGRPYESAIVALERATR